MKSAAFSSVASVTFRFTFPSFRMTRSPVLPGPEAFATLALNPMHACCGLVFAGFVPFVSIVQFAMAPGADQTYPVPKLMFVFTKVMKTEFEMLMFVFPIEVASPVKPSEVSLFRLKIVPPRGRGLVYRMGVSGGLGMMLQR